jgi:plasmid stabilization system protein ParE
MTSATGWTRHPVGERHQVVPSRLATPALLDVTAQDAAEAEAATARRFVDRTDPHDHRPATGDRFPVTPSNSTGRDRGHTRSNGSNLVFYLEQTDDLDVLPVLHTHRDLPASLQDAETDT